MKIFKNQGQILIADQVTVAGSFWRRLAGLLGRKNLGEGEGLLLYPCRAIHCLGMKFPIDVIFLDRNHQVIKAVARLAPGSFAGHKGAQSVLELKAGIIGEKNIVPGDRLIFS